MSHLSILPTVFTRLDLLEQSLRDEGFEVSVNASLSDVIGPPRHVDLLAIWPDCRPIGWVNGSDGTVVMYGDLQRISQSGGLSHRLQRVSRRYALLQALDDVQHLSLSSGQITVSPV